MKTDRIAEIFFLIVISTALFTLYYFYQPSATYSGCKLCDGNHYLAMYHYFEGNAVEYNILFPYYSRAMVSWLASLFSWSDPFLNFQLINLLFTLAGVAAAYLLWLRLNIPRYLMGIGLFWLLLHWTGIVRLNAMDPITPDVPTYFFQALFVMLVISRRFIALKSAAPVIVGVVLTFSAILMKLFSTISDPGENFLSFAEWYPEFAPPGVGMGSLYGVLYCNSLSHKSVYKS